MCGRKAALAACAGLAAFTAAARGAVHVELIDRGAPTGGGATGTLPPGYRGELVRIVSDEPILAVDAASSTGSSLDQNFGIFGFMFHFYVDPTGRAQFQPTPLDTATNAAPTLLNFDSHFLPPPSGSTFTVAPYEINNTDVQYPSGQGFPAAQTFYQYAKGGVPQGSSAGAPVDGSGRLSTAYAIGPGSIVMQLDLAYLFLTPSTANPNSSAPVQYRIGVTTTAGPSVLSGTFYVPEPSFGSFLTVCACLIRRGRRTMNHSRSRCAPATMEGLGAVVLPSVSAPSNVAAVMVEPNGDELNNGQAPTNITWTASPGSDGYRVYYSANQLTWILDATVTDAYDRFQRNLTGQKLYFKVTAFDATSQATSAIVSPIANEDASIPVTIDASSDSAITLTWPAVPGAAAYFANPNGPVYRVSRTLAGQASYTVLGAGVPNADGSQFSFQDTTAETGEAYRYTVTTYRNGYFGVSSTLAGGRKVFATDRGIVLLVIDQSISTYSSDPTINVATAVTRYKDDLLADGWRVETLNVARDAIEDPTESHASAVKQAIQAKYDALGGSLASIVLIGHVPVPMSGLHTHIDGHANGLIPPTTSSEGAWPADSYYGDLAAGAADRWTDEQTGTVPLKPDGTPTPFAAYNTNVPGDGKFDRDFNEAVSGVPVGRIDLSRLPGLRNRYPNLSDQQLEQTLLVNYFNRDHQFRIGASETPRTAIVDDEAAFLGIGAASWSSAYAVVGPAAVTPADWSTLQDPANRRLWGFGTGPGSPEGNLYGIATSSNYDAQPYHAVFNMMFGSFFGMWELDDSLMRTVLGNDGDGLVVLNQREGWNLAATAFGSPIFAAYTYTAVDQTIIGDPTLRQDNLKPPTSLIVETRQQNLINGVASNSIVHTLDWTASADPEVGGYYVYWSPTGNGGFQLQDVNGDGTADAADRLSATVTHYVDASGKTGGVFMVRAAKLTVTASGTYWNQSMGTMSDPVRSMTFDFHWADAPQWINTIPNSDVGLGTSTVTFALNGQRYLGVVDSDGDGVDDDGILFAANAGVPFDMYQALPQGPGVRSFVINIDSIGDLGLDHVLPTGRYTLHVTAPHYQGDYSFLFVTADATHDGRIDFSDLLVVARNYNQHYATDIDGDGVADTFDYRFLHDSFSIGDFNNDGVVDFKDYVELGKRYGLILDWATA